MLFVYLFLSVSTVEVIDSEQCVLVVDGLVDGNEEGEGGGQLDPAAQLLVAPVEAAQSLCQVPPACPLQSILQQLGLIGLVPRLLVPVDKDGCLTHICD